ncbi:MAG: 4-demethylwyosine synthase TYW1 [Candidatus Micrarchaeia archaeon]|jgi:tRNA wybutosine-synthesizing protein 1
MTIKLAPQGSGAPATALSKEQLARLEKAGYELVGKHRHSAVKVCHWCKKAILNGGQCYKNKFYGISSECCVQFTPALPFCTQKCMFCWRDPASYSAQWIGEVDGAKDIAQGAIKAQLHNLNGFPGNAKVNMKVWKNSQKPKHVAISLAGEPCLYPQLPQIIKEFHEMKLTTFLVSNGTRPEMFEQLANEKALPTQLYLSLAAFDQFSHEKICLPQEPGTWKKYEESLEIMASLKGKTRTVLRMTLMKNLNMGDAAVDGFSKLIALANPDYVEAKSYMHVGASYMILEKEEMPSQAQISEFSQALAKKTGYLITDEHGPSAVTLLCRDERAQKERMLKPG